MLSCYIVEGRLRPGQQVFTAKLSKDLGMGRTPVREALLRLQSDGIIICKSWHSYNVRVLTVHEIKEICETLGTLEGWAAGAACKRITPKDIEALEEYKRLIWRAAERINLPEYGRWNREFHGVFLTRFGNRLLHNLCDTIRMQFYAYPVQGKLLGEWLKKTASEHEVIIRLARNKDAKKVEAYFRRVHWSFSKNRKYFEDAFHTDGQGSLPA